MTAHFKKKPRKKHGQIDRPREKQAILMNKTHLQPKESAAQHLEHIEPDSGQNGVFQANFLHIFDTDRNRRFEHSAWRPFDAVPNPVTATQNLAP